MAFRRYIVLLLLQMATLSPSVSNRKLLNCFEEETKNTIIPQVNAQATTKTFFYISDEDIADAGSGPAAFETVRSCVRVIKLLKPVYRRKHELPRLELKIIQKTVPENHRNLVELVGFDCTLHNYIQLSYVGPTLQILDRFQYNLPNAFIWSMLGDLAAALAFLHWGVPATYTEGDALPQNRRPISHGAVSASSIHLSVQATSRCGYPRAVLTNFSDAREQNPVQGGGAKNAHEWRRAKLDVRDAACVMHQLAHGLPYKNETRENSRKTLFCSCLSARNCPAWLNRDSIDREMAGVLELACNVNAEQITSMALLGYINGPQGFAGRFPKDTPPLHPQDKALLSSQLPSNGEIRSVISRLRGVYVDEEDRLRGDADITEGGDSPVDESGVSLKFRAKALRLIVHGSEEWGIPPSPGSDRMSLCDTDS